MLECYIGCRSYSGCRIALEKNRRNMKTGKGKGEVSEDKLMWSEGEEGFTLKLIVETFVQKVILFLLLQLLKSN